MTITAKELREATLRGEGPLANAADDEPVFLVRAQDNLSDGLVDGWDSADMSWSSDRSSQLMS